jgi:hypothetical protein
MLRIWRQPCTVPLTTIAATATTASAENSAATRRTIPSACARCHSTTSSSMARPPSQKLTDSRCTRSVTIASSTKSPVPACPAKLIVPSSTRPSTSTPIRRGVKRSAAAGPISTPLAVSAVAAPAAASVSSIEVEADADRVVARAGAGVLVTGSSLRHRPAAITSTSRRTIHTRPARVSNTSPMSDGSTTPLSFSPAE